MRVAVGADHGGFALKPDVVAWLAAAGHEVQDVGAHTLDADDDYPDFAIAVAGAVSGGAADVGIVLCGSGVGASVAANKVRGVRAAVCHDTYSARQGVEHDDMNVLCMGARVIGPATAIELVGAFLSGTFIDEGKYRRRLDKVLAQEGMSHD